MIIEPYRFFLFLGVRVHMTHSDRFSKILHISPRIKHDKPDSDNKGTCLKNIKKTHDIDWSYLYIFFAQIDSTVTS